jgi:ElaB/YqjD/DUF883 family membrane-anchored ribosome-binding protein
VNTEATDTGEIERELDQTRSRLDTTIDGLQQKLAPGSMVDQAVEYFTEGGGVELRRNLGRSMRNNPIPVALIGVGIGWLALANSRRGAANGDSWSDRPGLRGDRVGTDIYGRYRSGTSWAQDNLATKAQHAGAQLQREAGEAEDAFQDRVDAARAAVLGLKRDAGEAADGFRRRVTDAMNSAAERVKSAVGESVGQLAERGQSAARDLYDYGASATADARDRAGSAMGHVRDMGSRTVDYVQDQPLLLGALGLIVGAAIGLLVPSSRYERQLAGSLRENLGDAARQMAGDASQSVARVASSVLDTAQDSARREGLIDENGQGITSVARDKVGDLAGRARHVVEETAAAGHGAIKRELSSTDDINAPEATRGFS